MIDFMLLFKVPWGHFLSFFIPPSKSAEIQTKRPSQQEAGVELFNSGIAVFRKMTGSLFAHGCSTGAQFEA